jgi:hypothetical protein
MRASRFKPTASMVVAILALVVAASGTAVAASHLVNGDKLIKKDSLSGGRIRAHTITGGQINMSKLGTVPSATNATNATNAATAGSAAISRLVYESSNVTLSSDEVSNGRATCPAWTNVVAGGARLADEQDDLVVDSFPFGQNAWQAAGFGDDGDQMTVYAVCAPASSTTS